MRKGPPCVWVAQALYWHLMTNVASSFRSIPRMTVALRIAIGMCFVLYSAVGIGGYLTFGSSTEGNNIHCNYSAVKLSQLTVCLVIALQVICLSTWRPTKPPQCELFVLLSLQGV